jgi:hypothetical protein
MMMMNDDVGFNSIAAAVAVELATAQQGICCSSP